MKNSKKMDDFVFINTPLTEKEDKEFGDFLKARKTKLKQRNVLKSAKRKKKVLV